MQRLELAQPERLHERQRLRGEPLAAHAVEVEHQHVAGERVEVEAMARVLHATVAEKPLRTRIEQVRFDASTLRPATVRERALALRRRPALRLEGVLELDWRGGQTGWDAVGLELAWIDVGTGAVTELPLRSRRSKRTFRLRATFDRPAADSRLRLRLTWRNSAWETEVARFARGRLKR